MTHLSPRPDPSTAAYVTEQTRFILGCFCIALIGILSVCAAYQAEQVERRAHIERNV